MKYRLKDLLSPEKWAAFARYVHRKILGEKITPEDKQWQSEVVVFRGLMCPECKEAGKCIGTSEDVKEPCYCSWEGKSGDMSLSCTIGRWPPVKDKNDWEKIKERFRVKLGLVQWEKK